MFEDFGEIFEIFFLVDAEVVGVPPEVEDFTVLSCVSHCIFNTAHAEGFEEVERLAPWAKETACGNIHYFAPIFFYRVCMVSAYVYVVVVESECTNEK